MKGSGRMVLAAALLPCVLTAAASLVAVCAAALGAPVWAPQDVTLSEAVAVRNRGEMIRLIALGANPNQAQPVRVGLMDDVPLVITPLEAAVGIGRADLVLLLLNLGALPSTDDVRVLRCYADFRQSEARAVLHTLWPEPWPDCQDVTLPNERGRGRVH